MVQAHQVTAPWYQKEKREKPALGFWSGLVHLEMIHSYLSVSIATGL